MMSTIKTIVGNVVTLDGIKYSRIFYDASTGLILNVDNNNIIKANSDHDIYSDDCLIFPGMGDIHIHAREDMSLKNIYKEDFSSTCCAAINGGVVHVGDMPNNPIPPIDDISYSQKVELSKNHPLPFLMYAGIGPHTKPLSLKVPYKAYMGPSIGELYFKNNEELELAISRYPNEWISFHCEDPIVLEMNKNKSNHFDRRPVEAEVMATETALRLIQKYNLHGKLCHFSSDLGLDLINKYKRLGMIVKTEVTPQHLFFSREIINKNKLAEVNFFQMNPPIRHEEDRLRLLDALIKGEIDYLATDHAPHSLEEKRNGMSGMAGLDTYAPFISWLLNEMRIDPITILKVTSYNPGLFFNEFLPELAAKFPHYKRLGLGMGVIAPGFSASFTVINLKKEITIGPSNLFSKSKWSPFLGHKFSGSKEAVFLSGKKQNN
jgi:dihydroorotase